MSTGEFEGLHSSGKGLGIDGPEEEKEWWTPFPLNRREINLTSLTDVSVLCTTAGVLTSSTVSSSSQEQIVLCRPVDR